ncbi:hypothetical protein K1719_038866 [Acacia pycnantha]|nr:hypothetical protein K1719_038866 [Acacia pycnantha]
MTFEECKAKCSQNYSCTAYANSDIRGEGIGCVMWFGDLIDMNQMSNVGQDLYIHLAGTDTEIAKPEGANENKRKGIVIGATILAAVVMLFTFLYIYRRRKSKVKTDRTLSIENSDEDTAREDMELPLYNFDMIASATDIFSTENKLGQGMEIVEREHPTEIDRCTFGSLVLNQNEDDLPQPKEPGFLLENMPITSESSASSHTPASMNKFSITEIEPR